MLWLTIGLLALLTRGLHLDGFADTMDGLASGGSKEKILEVMRDSRIGAFGVIGLILLIGGKVSCSGSNFELIHSLLAYLDGCDGKKFYGLGLFSIALCKTR